MRKLTQEKMNQVLNENGVFNKFGDVQQLSIYHISTHHSITLIDGIYEFLLYDSVTAIRIYTYLQELYDQKPYDIIIGILRTFYLILELDILKFLRSIDMIYRWQEMYSLAVVNLTKMLCIPLIDIRGKFLCRQDLSELLCKDGMHPTYKGYELIAKTIYEHLGKRVTT